ncbi:MAG: hypothetical protein WCX65_05735 [bacterium]
MQRRKRNNFERLSRFALLISAALFVAGTSGCGSALRYKLPGGKTLVYGMSSVVSWDEDGKEVRAKATKKNMEITADVLDCIAGKCLINLKARLSDGASDPVKGSSLGELEIRIDRSGRIIQGSGMGLPLETRLLFPVLPNTRLKNNQKWSEPFDRKMTQAKKKIRLEHEFLGKTMRGGRQCYHIRGTASFVYSRVLGIKEKNLIGTATTNYKYSEDFYLSLDGYPLDMIVKEESRRVFVDNYTGETVITIEDALNTELALLRIE